MDASELGNELVEAINGLHGVHPGHRAVHASGVLLAGRFRPTPAARALSRAPHLSGEELRLTARFSNGSGDPNEADLGSPDARGLAVKWYLPDGSTADLVTLTLPVFFVRTVEDFLAFTRARRPDPETGQPDLAVLGAYLEAHPEALPAIQAAVGAQPPASYACCRYHAIHAFRLVAADGARRLVRFRLEPAAGVVTLDADQAQAAAPDHLRSEALERVSREPIAFDLVAQLGEPGDPADDPTAAWPDERETVVLGRLELTGPELERETGDDVLVFDPTRVPDGVELTDDPILHARSHAYAASVERRTGVARAPARP